MAHQRALDVGPEVYAEYGSGVESKLLAGIMGHNLCLDIFGGPSEEEFAAGITVHGEGSVAAYEIEEGDGGLTHAGAIFRWRRSRSSGASNCASARCGFARAWRI